MLLLSVILVVAAGVLLGTRSSSYTALQDRVSADEVSRVEVDSVGLTPGQTGYSTVRLAWRDGWMRRTAEVISARPVSSAPPDRDTAVVSGDVAEDLRRLGAEVVVVPVARSTEVVTVAGWGLSGWLCWIVVAQLILGLVLLRYGPPPWRATRWGWAWPVLAIPSLGLAAYLLLAGPGLVRRPPDDARRLTGGWSFLLTVLVLVPLLT